MAKHRGPSTVAEPRRVRAAQRRWAAALLCGATACQTTDRPKALDAGPAAGDDAGALDSAAGEAGPDPVLRGALSLAWPVAEPSAFGSVIGVDHDPEVQPDTPLGRLTCADHHDRAFPHCYDEHGGTDIILTGGFSAMDAGSQPVIAAADGVVIATEDGHYDRCHASAETGSVDCDGHPMIANHVILEHEAEDGTAWTTRYWHLKQGSVAVAIGEAVSAGHTLGLVGSSGFSSMPHLHFQLEDPSGQVVDPFAGPRSQPETFWCSPPEGEAPPGPCAG